MAKFISKNTWDKYRDVVNDFIDKDAGQQPFLWLKHRTGGMKYSLPQPHGEDSMLDYTPVNLKGLFHHNYVRVWPYNIYSPSGALDNTSTVLYISKRQLEEGGYINEHGNWVFDNILDRFIFAGQVYKPAGDTPVAQIDEYSLLFFVVLQVEDTEESRKLVKQFKSHI